MAERKAFLLRLDPSLHAVLQRWADEELRSLNGQLEFLLRREAQRAGRLGSGREGPQEPQEPQR
jgi:hypothetical protein